MNEILSTTKYVVENSDSVFINQNKLAEIAETIDHTQFNHWLLDAPIDFQSLSEEEKLNFVLIFSAISFSYWGEPKWTIEYEGKKIDGSYGLIMALKRAMEEGMSILDLKYITSLSRIDFEHITRANTEIPLLDNRLKILNEIGKVLMEKYDGEFSNLIKTGNKDVNVLRRKIIQEIPSFQDCVEYKGQTVFFHKRVQVLISDIHELFKGAGIGEFTNPGELTAGADYKLPQILRKFGILSYSKELSEKIDSRTPLVVGSPEETEIRANTIWVVEYMKEGLKKRGIDISSMLINDHLWNLTQVKNTDDKPYHLVRTQSY